MQKIEQKEIGEAEKAQEILKVQQKQSSEDLNRVVFKLAKFLFNKNLLQEFKKQHSRQKQFMADIEGQIQKPLPSKNKKPKKKKKKNLDQQRQNQQQDIDADIMQAQLHGKQSIENEQQTEPNDKRWKVWVRNFEQFMKNEYYLFEDNYYKLKSASLTMFQGHFKLSVVNTRNNRKEELIVPKSKRVYWVNTTRIELTCEENESGNKYLVQLPSSQKILIENEVYLQAIKKYWNKATFYAVVPTSSSQEPCPEIIMIQFNY